MNYQDSEIINSALISLKHLRVMYTYFTEEAGTPELYKKANQLFSEVSEMQRNTYQFMIDEKMMTVSPQTKTNIEKSAKQLNKKVSEL